LNAQASTWGATDGQGAPEGFEPLAHSCQAEPFHDFPAAAIAISTKLQAALASRLLTAMMLGFGAFVWAPALFAKPGDHITWAGSAITLALAGAAWVIADSILLVGVKGSWSVPAVVVRVRVR
jgi:hypothetical protein